MYELLGLCLALATLLALNTVASVGATVLWRVLAPVLHDWPAAARARLLFSLRLLPAIAALALVCLLLLPAYIAHEPRQSDEMVGNKLALLAGLSAAGLLLAGWRGAATWLATRRLMRNWLRQAEPLILAQLPLPVYRLRHPFPVLALLGVWRPRLFVSEQLLAELDNAELAAALAHEAGHLAAWDNGKRACLRVCRDVLTLLPCGRTLDRAWDEAAEEAADEYAAGNNAQTALDLAAALVKIARLTPPQTQLLVNASFLSFEQSLLARRVKRLLQQAEGSPAQTERLLQNLATAQWIIFSVLLLPVLFISYSPAWLAKTHSLLELIVRSLQ